MIRRYPFPKLGDVRFGFSNAFGWLTAGVAYVNDVTAGIIPARNPRLNPNASAAAVAAAAFMNIYTVTAGFRPKIDMISLSASVAAQYSLQYDGVVIWSGKIPAFGSIILPFGTYGKLITTTGGLFRMQNNGAGAADLSATLYLDEI